MIAINRLKSNLGTGKEIGRSVPMNKVADMSIDYVGNGVRPGFMRPVVTGRMSVHYIVGSIGISPENISEKTQTLQPEDDRLLSGKMSGSAGCHGIRKDPSKSIQQTVFSFVVVP